MHRNAVIRFALIAFLGSLSLAPDSAQAAKGSAFAEQIARHDYRFNQSTPALSGGVSGPDDQLSRWRGPGRQAVVRHVVHLEQAYQACMVAPGGG